VLGLCLQGPSGATPYPELTCAENAQARDACGLVTDLESDGGFVVGVMERSINGVPRAQPFKILSAGTPASPLLDRLRNAPGPLSDMALSYDRAFVVNSSSGSPVLTRVDSTDLTPMGLTPFATALYTHPLVSTVNSPTLMRLDGPCGAAEACGDGFQCVMGLCERPGGFGFETSVVVSPDPGAFSDPADRRPDGSLALRLFNQEKAGADDVFWLNRDAAGLAYDVQPWRSGEGYAVEGSMVAWLEMLERTAAGQPRRVRLNVIDLAGCRGRAGCVDTPRYLTSVEGDATLQAGVFSPLTLNLAKPDAVHPTIDSNSALRVQIGGGQVFVYNAEPDGGTVDSAFGAKMFDVNGYCAVPANNCAKVNPNGLQNVGTATLLDGCGAAYVSELTLGCVYREGGRLRVALAERTSGDHAWSTATVTVFDTTNVSADLFATLPRGGQPTGFWLVDRMPSSASGVPPGGFPDDPSSRFVWGAEFEESEVSGLTTWSIYVLDPGRDGGWNDGIWQGGAISGNEESVTRLHRRIDLGGHGLGVSRFLNDGRIVFADSNLTLQPEIMRLSLRTGNLERLTDDDGVQIQPATLSTGAILYVDERYKTTALGTYLDRTGFTMRGLP